MTLHKIKETLVDEKKLMSSKELSGLIIRVGISVICACLDVSFMTWHLFGAMATFIVVVGAMLGFSWIFDLLKEDGEYLPKVKKFGNMFPVFIVLLVVEFFVLKYFRFF